MAKVLISTVMLLMLALSGAVWAAPDTSTSDFIDNGDGTVQHKKTGLVWMRCALGQTWDGQTCKGEAKRYTYDEAVNLTADYAGHSDWRLPTVRELQTLVERKNESPAINTTLFPNTNSEWFWSSTPYVSDANSAWIVYFYDGNVSYDNRSLTLPVRLVRDGQCLGFCQSPAKYTAAEAGTVVDESTGLTWSRCSVGQSWNGSTCTGTAQEFSFAEAQKQTSTLAGNTDWRVPTASELATLVDYRIGYPGPTLDTKAFPNSPGYVFWSSSPYVVNSDYAWFVYLYNGSIYYDLRKNTHPVRLVRGGQCSGFCQSPSADTTPDGYTLNDPTGITPGQVVLSNVITVSGINAATPISLSGTGAAYSVNGGGFATQPGTVNNGDRVQLRLTASSGYSTSVDAILTIGGVSDTFTVTTQALLADTTPDTPTSDFVDNGDGTVQHKKTGLVWMRCSMGQTWDGQTCKGEAKTYTYDQAVRLTTNYAGRRDWRLPTVRELQTMVERENPFPAINTTLFPNTPSDWLWSSSPYAGDADYVWHVDFGYGGVASDDRSDTLAVRLVRGGQCSGFCQSPAQYTVAEAGTVVDEGTGLMWSRCSVGQSWNGRTCTGTAQEFSFAEVQKQTSTLAGYTDWRVPTASELATLVDYRIGYPGPTLDAQAFPDTPSDLFWSSSPYAGSSDYAWVVSFSYGSVYLNVRYDTYAVRLVRGGQCLGFCQSLPADTTPDGYTLNDQTALTPGQVVLSNVITVSGINAATSISINGGSYSINGGAFTGVAGIVNNGDRVQLRLTASSGYSTSVDAILTIGGVSDTFTVTTLSPPVSPSATSSWSGRLLPPKTQQPIVSSGISYGQAMAVAGNQLWIGAPLADSAGQKQRGVVQIWVRQASGKWVVGAAGGILSQGKRGDAFGSRIALGKQWAVVSAPSASVGNLKERGQVWVYPIATNGRPGKPQLLNSPDSLNQAHFGWGVALSDTWLAVGAPGTQLGVDKATSNGDGSVYLYALEKGAWVFKQKLSSTDKAGRFGASVAMDKDKLVIGAPGAIRKPDIYESGQIYAYHLAGNKWVLDDPKTTLLPPIDEVRGGHLGETLTMQGNTLVVGAPLYSSKGVLGQSYPKAGRVFGYGRDQTTQTWLRNDQALEAPVDFITDKDYFGSSLALANNGQLLLVGAPGTDQTDNKALDIGRAYLYQATSGGWSRLQVLDVVGSSGLGTSLALMSDAAWVSTLKGEVWLYQPGK